MAPGTTWEEPELPADADSKALEAWLDRHPRSFHGWRRLAARLLVEGKLDRAKEALETFKGLYPEYVGPENAYVLLAAVSRKQSDPAGERKALEDLVARDGSASPAYLRLMELEEAAERLERPGPRRARLLAVNPLIPAPYRQLAQASEQLGRTDEALAAYRAVVLLDDSDPADIHYRLARLLQRRASGTRPAARSSSRSRRPRGSSMPTGSCSSWSNRPEPPPAPIRIPRPRGPDHDTKTCDPAGDPAARGDRRRPGRGAVPRARPRPGGFGGGRGGYGGQIPADRAGVPNWKIDERFKHDVFTFVRVEYNSGYGGRGRAGGWGGGWATDWPDSDLNFSFRLQQLTSLKVNPDPISLRLTDPKLFDYPFLYMIEPGGLSFTEEEVVALRRYLLNGGFLMVDDFWGDVGVGELLRADQAGLPRPRAGGTATSRPRDLPLRLPAQGEAAGPQHPHLAMVRA